MDNYWIEIVGYIASSLIAIGMLMNSIVRLRIICCLGALMFGTYGVLIGAVPVILLNYFIAVTNIYYLWKMYKNKKS